MAEKLAPDGETKRKKKAAREPINLDNLRKRLAPYVKEIMGMYDDMEADHGSHVLSISSKFEKVAEATGFGKGLLRSEIARIRRNQKAEAKEKEMDPEEREETERFRAALEGTPLANYAAGKLAKGAVG